MKLNYEKNNIIIILIIILIIIEIYLFTLLFIKKINKYELVEGVVIDNNLINIMADNNQYNLLKKTDVVYIDNKKVKRKIKDVSKNMFKKNNKNYHYIVLKIKTNKKYKINDSIYITIYHKKIKLISIFKSCWKEVK